MAHLLVVDDESSICWGLSKLGQQMGHSVDVAASAEEGLEKACARRPDAVVLDVRLPGMDGLAALERFHDRFGPLPVIVITAFGELTTAVRAVRFGAFDYLTKPFELKAAERAIARALEAGPAESRAPPRPDEDAEGRIVGSSPPMQELFKRVALVAPTEACVHLRGESGTGKELVARAIHRYSRRSGGPFVAVNVASLSPTLVESELFGHAQGAFTGADRPRKGLLERAHGGTIFFDEVADVPLPVQVKLLRALEYGEVLPVGAERPAAVDFRVISATHRDLRQRVAEGKFRHDLYYRLIAFEIGIPPLRDRPGDLRPLAEHFLDLLAARNDRPRPAISPAALADLEARTWHGNVRELRNAIEHAMVLSRSGLIEPEHLPEPAASPVLAGQSAEETLALLVRRWAEVRLRRGVADGAELHEELLRVVEPPLFQAALEQNKGQCAAAARQLGLHRTTLRRKLDQYGIAEE